jgi:pyruvate formate lyase activating enzyme
LSIKLQLKKTSFIDYPARISSVFFFPGCNLRCPWCHNRELVTGGAQDLVSLEDALAHLRKRRGILGGVVLSGGEPCLWKPSAEARQGRGSPPAGLPDLIAEIKAIPLPVKLDTNGMLPAMLEKLFALKETRPDYIALDLKIAPIRYAELARKEEKPRRGTEEDTELYGEKKKNVEALDSNKLADKLIQSAALIRESGIAHEYRTLALPGGYISVSDIEALAPLADNAPWYFRPFAGGNCLESTWDDMEEPAEVARARLEALAARAKELGKAACVPGE